MTLGPLWWCLLVLASTHARAQGVGFPASGSGFLSAIPTERNKYYSSGWVSCDGYSKSAAKSNYCHSAGGYWCEYQNTNLCSPKYSARCGTSSVWCNLDFLCPESPSDVSCPPKGYPKQCQLAPSLYCPVDTDCIKRWDGALVCELQDNVSSLIPALSSKVKCGKVSRIDLSAITSSSFQRKVEIALRYSYDQSVAVQAPLCSNQMRIVNQFEFDAPQTGNYTISFVSTCINAALNISPYLDGCDSPNDSVHNSSSAVCLSQRQGTNVSLKRGAKLLLQFGAADGLRCVPNTEINISTVYIPSQVQVRAPLYLYISVPVFVVLAVLMGLVAQFRSGLIGLWMCSACEISGILVYLIVADFVHPEIFVAMIAFLVVTFVCAFVTGLFYLKDYAGLLNAATEMIPKPSVDLRLNLRASYPDGHARNELADYMSIAMIVLSRVASQLVIVLLGSILWIMWLVAQVLFTTGTALCIFISYIVAIIFVVYLKSIVFLYPRGTWAEEHKVVVINVVILGDLFLRTIPLLILVIFNGLAIGQTETVFFIYAVFGSSLTIANTTFAVGVVFCRSKSVMLLQYDRFLLLRRSVEQRSQAPQNGQTPMKSSQTNVRKSASPTSMHYDSHYPTQQKQKPMRSIVEETPLPNTRSGVLESQREQRDASDARAIIDLSILDEPEWINPVRGRRPRDTSTNIDLSALDEPEWINPVRVRRPRDTSSTYKAPQGTGYSQESGTPTVTAPSQCGICFSENTARQVLGCGHVLCPDCVHRIRTDTARCPFCKADITIVIDLFMY